MVTLAPRSNPELAPRRRIEILGVFGSGKTTLARQLSGDDRLALHEDHERIPFWGSQPLNLALGFLPYDLAFLLQHTHLVASAPAAGLLICDWSFASDLLWASMRLGDDFPAYEAVHSVICARIGAPEAYLYLRQPTDEIAKRLGWRGRRPEKDFLKYVKAAAKRLEEFVESLPSERLLIANDALEFEQVLVWLRETRDN